MILRGWKRRKTGGKIKKNKEERKIQRKIERKVKRIIRKRSRENK